MRKNTARHWLHGALDLLPVLLIPVFMIYSHRHTMTNQTTVDIQYKYQSNEVNSVNDLVEGNIYYLSYFTLDDFPQNITNTIQLHLIKGNITDYQLNGVDEEYLYDYFNVDETYILLSYFGNQSFTISFNYDEPYITYTLDILEIEDLIFTINDNLDEFKNYNFTNIPQFTSYNEIESVEVNDETSSVMNVFMDNFNNAIDKYFNMGNVFNMTNVYQWFNTNIFGGNAPVVIYSVWNIVLYEFVMDLLFLLYGLFMWFIDMCKRLMEKPLDSIK